MYLDFYQLNREPFNITPDPDFLYLSAGHKEALAAIVYGVEQRKGFISIVGEVGVGKTTVLRSYLDRVDRERLRPIYLFNPILSFDNLLRVISRDLGVTLTTDDLFGMVNQIHEFLINEYTNGRNIVLLIDEAQNMPVETLENLRMLSNLETSKEKLIQVVFSAQPEFEKLLEMKELRQLKQRIAVKATIRPLNKEESLAYINYRLGKAVVGSGCIFTPGAMKIIVAHAKGVPRTINILCDNSLITSFGYKRHRVDGQVVKEIINDFTSKPKAPTGWLIDVITAVVTVISCIAIILFIAALPIKGQPSLAISNPSPVHEIAHVKVNRSTMPGTSGTEPLVTSLPPQAVTTVKTVESPSQTSRIVKKGDTLAMLILDRYGYVNKRLMESVKLHNPQIKHEDRIVEGERIVFPEQRH
jgi:general secretion pathway protein A